MNGRTDYSTMRAWLDEQSPQFAAQVAVRAALRAAPALAALIGSPRDDQQLALRLWHSMATATLAASWEQGRGELADIAKYASSYTQDAELVAGTYQSKAAIKTILAALSATFPEYVLGSESPAASAVYALAQSAATGRTMVEGARDGAVAAARPTVGLQFQKAAELDLRILRAGGDLIGSSLWPRPTPKWALEWWAWAEDGLLALDQDWDVWAMWYRRRLQGVEIRSRDELPFVQIPFSFRKLSAGKINAAIRNAADTSLEDLNYNEGDLQPLEGVPAAVAFTWSAEGILAAIPAPDQQRFPVAVGRADHEARLATSRSLTQDLIEDLDQIRYNVRPEYKLLLQRYNRDIPRSCRRGSLMYPDASMRNLRQLFAADAPILPPAFASSLRTLMEQHIALRAYYPEISEMYRDIQTGHLQEPLRLDAYHDLESAIQRHTPSMFDATVSLTLVELKNSTELATSEQPAIADDDSIRPPPDPLGTPDPSATRDYLRAGVINRLWTAFLEGSKLPHAIEGWQSAYSDLAPAIASVLRWLRSFIG